MFLKVVLEGSWIASILQSHQITKSVVASSGTYNVKIAKRGGTFGITIAGSTGRRPGDPLRIQGVVKGSVAHRTGVIHPGDVLLAVESVRTEAMSVDDAARLLQNVDDLVTLKIRKEPSRTEEEEEETVGVSYTVELHRNGGPLGITLSGTEEPFDPIFVSALTEHGLAQRTGAIQVGDELLAINGRPLHGKPLSEAISALQTAGDIITVRVLRRTQLPVMPAGYVNRQESRTEVTVEHSGDSAVDSWESTGTDPHRISLHTRPTGQGRLTTFQAQPSRDSACSADSDHHSRTSAEQDEWNRTVEEYQQNRQVLSQLETALISNDETKPMLMGSRRFLHRHSLSSDEKSSSVSSGQTRYTELDIMKIQEQIHNSSKNIQTELMKVTLYKNADTDNFGLSVSDGMFEKGVFISALRPGGPADKCGVLRTYDRILQVNHIKVRDMDCCLVVPLIAASGNQIDLIVARNPLAQPSEEEDTTTTDGSESPPPPPPSSPPPSPPLPPPPMDLLPSVDDI